MMKNKKNLIWYEKHRPKSIGDLILNDYIQKHLNSYIKKKEIPHLLLTGPAGSGKTTIANILIEQCASNYLTLNASSEDRGIATIKTKVRHFASKLRLDKNKINIIFMDEADGLSHDSQGALKNTIERYQSNCRFIFAANELQQIQSPIRSRCTHFQFDTLPFKDTLISCKKILKHEKVQYEKSDIKIIIKKYYPDVRSIINNLQSCSIDNNLNLKHMMDKEPNLDLLKNLLVKAKIGAIREMWLGISNFIWLYQYLFNTYLKTIKSKYIADCALSVAEYMYKDKFAVDKEINAIACIIDICMIQEKEIKF